MLEYVQKYDLMEIIAVSNKLVAKTAHVFKKPQG